MSHQHPCGLKNVGSQINLSTLRSERFLDYLKNTYRERDTYTNIISRLSVSFGERPVAAGHVTTRKLGGKNIRCLGGLGGCFNC